MSLDSLLNSGPGNQPLTPALLLRPIPAPPREGVTKERCDVPAAQPNRHPAVPTCETPLELSLPYSMSQRDPSSYGLFF